MKNEEVTNPVQKTTAPKRARRQHLDRITLKTDALNKIDLWLDDVRAKFKGIKLTRSDFVNWLVVSHVGQLSNSELEQIKQTYFDEEQLAQWALREIRARKARGENVSLSEIIKSGGAKSQPTARSPRKKTSNEEAKSSRDSAQIVDRNASEMPAPTNTNK